MRPKKPPATFYTNFRGSITDFATIALWIESKGITPRSKSEIVNIAIANLKAFIDKTCPQATVKTVEEGLRVLERMGLVGSSIERVKTAMARSQFEATAREGSLEQEGDKATMTTPASSSPLSPDLQKLLEQARIREARTSQALRENLVPTQEPEKSTNQEKTA